MPSPTLCATLRGLTALLTCAALPAPLSATAAPGPGPGDLLLSSRFTDEVLRYDPASGAFLGVFADDPALDNPVGLTFGPDGHLYVASADNDRVLRFDGASGALLGVFAAGPELVGPRQLQFGPDGHLYVASAGTDEVLRYDGATGAFLGVFTQGGGLDGPNGLTFGPGADLFVASVLTGAVQRYDGESGAWLADFATAGLKLPHDVSFGPDGHLYTTDAGSTRVMRHDGASGALLGPFVDDPALSFALGMLWTAGGDLLVVNQGKDEVRLYDGLTGGLLQVLVTPGSGGLDGPLYAATVPAPAPALAIDPGLAGAVNHVALEGFAPGARVVLASGTVPGLRPLPGCGGLGVAIGDARFFGAGQADEGGRLVLRRHVPAGASGLSLLLQATDPGRCVLTPLVQVDFP